MEEAPCLLALSSLATYQPVGGEQGCIQDHCEPPDRGQQPVLCLWFAWIPNGRERGQEFQRHILGFIIFVIG